MQPSKPHVKLVKVGGGRDLLRTTLEMCLAEDADKLTKVTIGDLVNTLSMRADGIINESAGEGPDGKCPFFSAYEVHLFYQFCLLCLDVWSEHTLGGDQDLDAAFYSQLAT